jgi:3-dehydrosphinganine reductase
MADILYCVAGGTATECGFLADINATNLDSCMKNNYIISAYSASSFSRSGLKTIRTRKAGAYRLKFYRLFS